MMQSIRSLLSKGGLNAKPVASFANFNWLLPVFLLIIYYWLDPFKEVLVSNKVSLSMLDAAQRANIELAAKALDGAVLAPGAIFSFNKTVGPRTFRQGYLQSPSYLNFDTPMTLGGGICLLSSMLYKDALELGLTVAERTAHTRTTQSVPPGFDATVWYGRNDLKLINNLGIPLKLEAAVDRQTLTLNIVGANKSRFGTGAEKLRRIVTHANRNAIEVSVLRSDGVRLALISRDRYWLSGNTNSINR